jgi:hypothetical protein
MATIIRADGTIENMTTKKKNPSLAELQTAVGGYIEIVTLPNNKLLVVDEEGKLKNRPINSKATAVMTRAFGHVDVIVGDAVLCDASEIK